MREDLLYFIWRHNKLPTKQLYTTSNEGVEVKSAGIRNSSSGPDFFNAKVEINGQLWAGNVEMHVKSSDWYVHHHEKDKNYDNVILHVVWEDDVSVFRKDGSQIPTLELKQYISNGILNKYQELLSGFRTNFINCEKDLKNMDSFLVENWLHRLYIERLEHKSELISELLNQTNNDWEAVLFVLLSKNFGSNVNGQLFVEKAARLDFSIIRKTSHDPFQLESLLFGYFGLLTVEDCTDNHYQQLKKEYGYLAHKFGLPINSPKPIFYGLRPPNFPTLRISQLSKLYFTEPNLFSKLMELESLEDMYAVFEVRACSYWEDHFTFGKTSRKSTKKLSKKFIDLLVINTIVPLKFCYAKHVGNEWNDGLIDLVSQVGPEENSIVKNFGKIGSKSKNALETQSKLELFHNYCSKNKCLQCAIGAHLLNRNT